MINISLILIFYTLVSMISVNSIYRRNDLSVKNIVFKNKYIQSNTIYNHTTSYQNETSVESSTKPSAQPSSFPSFEVISHPSSEPSSLPSSQPSTQPTSQLSSQPTSHPSTQPSSQPSSLSSSQSSTQPSSQPSTQPSSQPSFQPTSQPSGQPSSLPSSQPSTQPSSQPSSLSSSQLSTQPSSQPSFQPTSQPSGQLSSLPSSQPTSEPSQNPTSLPTQEPTSTPTNMPSPIGLLGKDWWYLVTAYSHIKANSFESYKERDVLTSTREAFIFMLETPSFNNDDIRTTVLKANTNDDIDDYYTTPNVYMYPTYNENRNTKDNNVYGPSNNNLETESLIINVWCASHEALVFVENVMNEIMRKKSKRDIMIE